MKIYLFLLLSISSFRNQKVSGIETPRFLSPSVQLLKAKQILKVEFDVPVEICSSPSVSCNTLSRI
jgi:hypothetical protein